MSRRKLRCPFVADALGRCQSDADHADDHSFGRRRSAIRFRVVRNLDEERGYMVAEIGMATTPAAVARAKLILAMVDGLIAAQKLSSPARRIPHRGRRASGE